MKTSQLTPPSAFAPVQLVLETQDEVDCMHAIFNTSAISNVLRVHGAKHWPFELFELYTKDSAMNVHKIFNELRKSLEENYKMRGFNEV